MSKDKCKDCGKMIDYHGDVCDADDVRRYVANVKRNARSKLNRVARDETYKSCGLVKVRGAMGGTYWE